MKEEHESYEGLADAAACCTPRLRDSGTDSGKPADPASAGPDHGKRGGDADRTGRLCFSSPPVPCVRNLTRSASSGYNKISQKANRFSKEKNERLLQTDAPEDMYTYFTRSSAFSGKYLSYYKLFYTIFFRRIAAQWDCLKRCSFRTRL